MLRFTTKTLLKDVLSELPEPHFNFINKLQDCIMLLLLVGICLLKYTVRLSLFRVQFMHISKYSSAGHHFMYTAHTVVLTKILSRRCGSNSIPASECTFYDNHIPVCQKCGGRQFDRA